MAVNTVCRLAVFGFLAAVSLWHYGYGTAAKQPTIHIIEIRQMEFMPDHLKVAPGDIVTWVNRDIVIHNVADTSGGWRSADLQQGERFSLRVKDDLSFFCTHHPVMTGSLDVDGQIPE